MFKKFIDKILFGSDCINEDGSINFDNYNKKVHINKCIEGYYWVGGTFLGSWHACNYCNKNVILFQDMLKSKEFSLDSKIEIKKLLEEAKRKRANNSSVNS